MTFITGENKERTTDYGTLRGLMVGKKKNEKSQMKWLIALQMCTTIFVLAIVGIFYLVTYLKMKELRQDLTNITHGDSNQNGNVVTLYALDPVARTFCFGDGGYGQTISDWSVYNRHSDIDFNTYTNGSFTVGIEGGEVGTIIDLGSTDDLQKKYKYRETVGNGQGFASIHRQNKTILILKNMPYDHSFQPMEESIELFREGRSGASVPVRLGHLYVLRITDHTTATFERIVKMLVIAYKSDEWVTIRWNVMI